MASELPYMPYASPPREVQRPHELQNPFLSEEERRVIAGTVLPAERPQVGLEDQEGSDAASNASLASSQSLGTGSSSSSDNPFELEHLSSSPPKVRAKQSKDSTGRRSLQPYRHSQSPYPEPTIPLPPLPPSAWLASGTTNSAPGPYASDPADPQPNHNEFEPYSFRPSDPIDIDNEKSGLVVGSGRWSAQSDTPTDEDARRKRRKRRIRAAIFVALLALVVGVGVGIANRKANTSDDLTGIVGNGTTTSPTRLATYSTSYSLATQVVGGTTTAETSAFVVTKSTTNDNPPSTSTSAAATSKSAAQDFSQSTTAKIDAVSNNGDTRSSTSPPTPQSTTAAAPAMSSDTAGGGSSNGGGGGSNDGGGSSNDGGGGSGDGNGDSGSSGSSGSSSNSNGNGNGNSQNNNGNSNDQNNNGNGDGQNNNGQGNSGSGNGNQNNNRGLSWGSIWPALDSTEPSVRGRGLKGVSGVLGGGSGSGTHGKRAVVVGRHARR